MRIVSWNCCGGLDTRKVTKVSQYDADILVVPECREEDMAASGYPAEQRDWYGDHAEAPGNPHKDLGVGLFWKAGLRVERLWEGIAPCRFQKK